MGDESRKPDFKTESQGLDEDNRGLHECMQCGASISARFEFCRLCGFELSGGGWEQSIGA